MKPSERLKILIDMRRLILESMEAKQTQFPNKICGTFNQYYFCQILFFHYKVTKETSVDNVVEAFPEFMKYQAEMIKTIDTNARRIEILDEIISQFNPR